MNWSQKEVRLIIEDYFKMFSLELSHKKFNKTAYRNELLPFLNNREKGAIEFKHQNISAVLTQMGLPYIKGYKPRHNFQQILAEEVAKYINKNKISLELNFEQFSEEGSFQQRSNQIDFQNFLSKEPVSSILKEEQVTYKPIKTNYLEKEQNNRILGEEGEKLVIEYEKWRLVKAGKEALAEKIEWVSKDMGDGTGFDILSKNTNGTDRYIEVKTTKLSKETPIFLTSTEYRFAASKEKDFFLYRVFNFNTNPQFFQRNGSYDNYSILKPQNYKAYLT
jgi:hypothetical protein